MRTVRVRSHGRRRPGSEHSRGHLEAARYFVRLRLLDRIAAADAAGSVDEAVELRRDLVLLYVDADAPDLFARLRAARDAPDAETLDRLFAEFDPYRREGLR